MGGREGTIVRQSRLSRWLDARHDQRRRLELDRVRASGDQDRPVAWLLARDQRRSDRLLPAIARQLDKRRAGHIHFNDPELTGHIRSRSLTWSVPFVTVRSVKLASRAFPPGFAARVDALSSVYTFDDYGYRCGVRFASDARRPSGSGPLAGDWTDLTRWYAASGAYVEQLDMVDAYLLHHWRAYGCVIGLTRRGEPTWRSRRLWRAWRAVLLDGYERARAASEQYRPIFDEMTDAIGETAGAHQEVAIRYARLAAWEGRRIWHLVAHPDSYLIVRGDIEADEHYGDDRGNAGTIKWIYAQAVERRFWERRVVDWDEASIRACDRELAELAALAGDPVIGRTRSGRPMAVLDATEDSFAAWFDASVPTEPRLFGGYRAISDRERIATDADIAALQPLEAPLNVRRETDGSSRRSGSWPTSGGGFDGGGSYGPSFGTSF